MKYSITAEFLALEKTLNIYIDYLTFYASRQHIRVLEEAEDIYISTIWYFTQAGNSWNESILSASLQVYNEEWFHDEQVDKCNVFSVIRN